MKKTTHHQAACAAILLTLLMVFAPAAQAYSPKPDLTSAGVIAALKTDTNSSPLYTETYNLGSTGLRGWVYRDPANMGQEGLQTAQDRQILVTVVGSGTPAAGVLAVDDVILGVKAGTGATLTYPADAFTSDCRKAFGAAITAAEATANNGVLRLLRWRAGTISEVQITLPVMGDYAATAPYGCPKSATILANAVNILDDVTLSGGWDDAVSALALLAAVKPGDTNYNAVQAKLATFAHALAPADLTLSGCDTWNWGYIDIFLSEYYLRTLADDAPDASVLSAINKYTTALAKGQSKYGTFGHGGAEKHADGSLHGSISWYGPVNSAGLAANLGIVLGKKALVAGGIALDPEIDPAIERGSKFFAYFVNKGGVPYGEHEPWSGGHASNGKDSMAAVMFGLQDNRPVETEYFTRMSVAGWVGREYGHTGQGFSYLWSALGAAMGGDEAVTAHLNQVRWHLDLERRTDGSFVYDGGEQYGGSSTSTYLGASSYSGLNPTACFVLTYSLPLKRLLVTGRNANPVNTLSSAEVSNAIAAGSYERDCTGYSVATLLAAFSEYDPVVRHDAAAEMATRTLTATELNAQIALITNGTMSPDPNVRQAVCETLGIRKPASALTALGQRLSDTDLWVRGKASNALKNYGSAASPQLTTMLTAFTANATDPDIIVWDDPIQIANGYLADTLFQALATNTNALTGTTRTNLLYPALRAGLKQPDGMARMYLGDFLKNRLSLADVQAVSKEIVAAAAERSPADRMFSDVIRYAALNTLGKYKIEEGIPLCLLVKEQTWHGDDWDPFTLLQNTYRGAAKEALPTLYKWQEHIPQFAADGSIGGCCQERLNNIISKTASTIAAIENDSAPPTLVYLKTLNASAGPASISLPTTQTVLTSTLTDLDAGTPNFVWSKVSGAGTVAFSPSGMSANNNCTATFNTPGTYVLKVTAVDRSILDYNKWITYNLGYFDFQTYDEILGGVSKNVTVVVGPDPNRAPVSQNQGLTTALDTALPVTLTATDSDGDAMTFAVVTPPVHGVLSGAPPGVTYTPNAGYSGPDSFTFKANDGKVDSVPAVISIDVGGAGNRRAVAGNQLVTTAEDSTKAITLTGTDPDGDPLTYDIVTGPAHGTLTGTAPNLTYQPVANYPVGNLNGADSFTFTVRDASLTSAVATVSITVTPVNDPPQALAQGLSLPPNVTSTITLAGTDPEAYPLSYSVVTNPAHGTLSGTAPNLTYRPTANYHGADTFTFRATDSEGAASSAATVSITVINDPPVANPQSLELQPNISKTVTLTGSDNCNDPLTYAVVTQPTHGTLSGVAPNLTYTPAANYSGPDSFTFRTNDGSNNSPAATVSLNVVGWLTWTNVAAGTWSTGANWLGGTAPGAGGSSNGLLVFNTVAYSGTSNNNLAGTFSLSRLNFGTSLPSMTLSGNPLAFAVNSSSQPQVIHDSPGTILVSNNIAIPTAVTVSGTGAGALTFSGIISGAGSVTKTCSADLTLSGTNSYIGGTTVSSGTFMIGNKNGCGTGPVTLAAGTTFQQVNFEGNSSGGALPNAFVITGSGNVTMNIPFGGGKDIWLSQPVSGTGGINVQGGTRSLTLTVANSFSGGMILRDYNNRVVIYNAASLGTGTFRSERTTAGSGQLETAANLSAGTGVANAFDIASGSYLNVYANGTNHLLLSGGISGTGSLYKSGTATLTLTGPNTYGGTTKVAAGILSCSSPFSLGGGGLDITSGATVQLNYTGTRRVSSLTLGGVAQAAAGTYGSSTSGAIYQSAYFTGAGTVTVGSAFATTATTLVQTGGSSPAIAGSSLTFTATVANGSSPSGNVTFYIGNTLLGTAALNTTTLQASLTTTSLAAGTHAITARYAGDLTNDPSVSAPLALQVFNPADIQSFTIPGMVSATISANTISVTVPYATAVTALTPSYTLSPGATCDRDNGGPATYDFTSPVVYTVRSADLATTKTYTVTVVKAGASAAKDITSFVFSGLPTPTIGTNTITLSVPYGTAVNALTTYYTVSPLAVQDAVYPSGVARDFSTPQIYTIKDQAGVSKTYTATVTVATPSTACDILACSFTGLGAATISGTSVILTVPTSQQVTNLTPAFTISPLASISPASGVAQNFSSPVVYRVTAQNGTTFKDYTVSVVSYLNWPYSASLFILTTPDGANIAAGSTETNFPLLVRLNSSSFNFSQAQTDGRDIRFATAAGVILSYQIEQWDAAAGTASIWVKIPTVTGNARQEIKMYWGQAGVASESNGANVFSAANGYACVMHMNEALTDEVGAAIPANVGTTVATGMIGKGRNFTEGNGIACGNTISTFPQGTTAHSTQAWFRADSVNSEIVDWGVEGGGYNKVQIRLVSPPRIYVDGNFASVTGNATATPSQWHHVTHTYAGGSNGAAKIYLDGQLDASANVTMTLPNPSRMWIGGWYDGYSHVGDIDEVRVSKVARSANWIKLEYENQKPLQTLVGSPVQAGTTFAVSPAGVTMNEGASTTLTGQAGGAQKVYWIERNNGVDTVIATDVFSLNVNPGRVNGTLSYAIQFKAVYATEIKTVDIPITVTEYLPDPAFTLTAPTTWDGRQTINVTSSISNLTDMQAKGVGNLNYSWSATGVAVTRQDTAGTLTLLRSQGDGTLTVSLTIDNGGTPVTQTKIIAVQQPASDAWVQRTPAAGEKPVNNQFFARDDTGKGRIYYNGTQAGATSVFLRVYRTESGGDVLYSSQTSAGSTYAFTAPIDAGLYNYKTVLSSSTGGAETVRETVTNLVCGDAYIIEGQSNALATDNTAPNDSTTDPWIRTYGNAGGGWGSAISKGSEMELGVWGMILARRLSTNFNMPICIINGAVGGTRIDQHRPNPAGHSQAGSLYSIYADLYNRVVGAKLTHGIRGVLWHQGEQDQGSGGPDGDYDYKFYQQYFVDVSAAWKQDFPNIRHYYLFQIWPAACGDTSRNDQLREMQRTLPTLYSNMRCMSTVGIVPGSSCHYDAAGYQKFSDLIGPLMEQDNYGYLPASVFTAPDLKKAYYTSSARTEITLEFSQNVAWINATKGLFYLDGVAGKVASGSVSGNIVRLQLTAASTAQKITYLQGLNWDGIQGNLLYGTNGVAALTFADVSLTSPATITLARHSGTGATTTYGDLLSFDVTVTGGLAPTATGTVDLRDGGAGGTLIGSATLAGGTCTIASTALTTGVHSNIVAVYSGDSAYASGASSALSAQTVNKATPVVTITGPTTFTYTGAAQGPDTATTGGSTGSVTYSYAGTGYGPISAKPTNVGSYTVTATVAADPNYNAAASSPTAFTIKATPTLSVTNSPVAYNGSAQAAAVSGSVPGAVSNVRYNGSASVPTATGTYAITADFVPSDGSIYNSLTAATAGNFVIIPPLATSVGTATASAAGQTGITVTMPYTDDGNANNTFTVEYKFTAGGSWTTWVANAPHMVSPYATTLTGLTGGTGYDVRVTCNDPDGVTGTNPQTLTVSTASPGITELSAWSNLYHNTSTSQQNLSYPVPAGSGSLRVLVVAISSELTAFGARTVTLTYGGQALTPVNGDMATATVRQHTALYYLNNAGLIAAAAAASPTTLAVTVSGGTTRMTDVFAAVYDGVDQTAPITDSKTYSSGTTAVSTFAFSTGLAINAGNQAFGITCSDRTGSTTLRTVSTYPTNWALVTQQTSTTTDAIRNFITKRSVPATNVSADTSSTAMNNTSLGSMTALSLAHGKATPALWVTNSPTYNGSSQPATVAGSAPGTAINIRYNGSLTVPSAAGTYAVTADFAPTDSVNYNSLTTASAGSFVIHKATPTVAVANSPVTYNGSAQAATVNGSVAGTVSNLKYNGSAIVPTDAGSYAITADLAPADGTNYNSLTDASAGVFVIGKAAPTVVVANSPVTYNGSAQAATVNGSVAGTVSNVKYDGAATVPTAAGTYAITADFAPGDSVNFNNLTDSAAGDFVIQKATPTVAVANSPVTYNGSAQAATVNGSVTGAAGNVRYNGSATVPAAAGSYAITADFTPGDSVNSNNLTDAVAGDFVIQKATPTVAVANSPVTYNGSAQAATVNSSVAGTVSNVKYNGSAIVPMDAGSYAITADLAPADGTNYNSLTDASAGVFVIGKAAPTVVVANSPVTYNGSPQAATVNGSVAGTVSNVKYDGAATVPTAAGTYAITADFAPDGTTNFSNLTAAAAGNFVIQKAALTIAATGPAKTYGTALTSGPSTTNFTTTEASPGEIVTGVTLAFDSSGLSATAHANSAYVVTPSLATGTGGFSEDNYNIIYAPFIGTISKATATVTLSDLLQPFDGFPKAATASTVPASLAVNLTYEGSATPPSAKGSYQVLAVVSDENYMGSSTGTMVLGIGSIADWRSSHFTAGEITAGLAADNADPEGDGFTNLAEYTLGTDPHTFTPQPLAMTAEAGGQFTLTFVARAATGSGYEGLTRKYDLQHSSDLANPNAWQPVAGQTNIVGADQTVTATLSAGAPNEFYRLSVRVE